MDSNTVLLQTFATSTPRNDDVISLIGAGTVCQAKRYLISTTSNLSNRLKTKGKYILQKTIMAKR